MGVPFASASRPSTGFDPGRSRRSGPMQRYPRIVRLGDRRVAGRCGDALASQLAGFHPNALECSNVGGECGTTKCTWATPLAPSSTLRSVSLSSPCWAGQLEYATTADQFGVEGIGRLAR